MPDVISDTNGKLCVGSYHLWRLLSNPDNYSFHSVTVEEQNVNIFTRSIWTPLPRAPNSLWIYY